MISDNQTDVFFSERLRDYPSAVPADMWNRILEKKKRDRMIWLFFLRFFAIIILSLALAGGYLMFKQKKSTSAIGKDSTKINHLPAITETTSAGVPNVAAREVQPRLSPMNVAHKKTNKIKKTESVIWTNITRRKVILSMVRLHPNQEKILRIQSTHLNSSIPADSITVKENKTEEKKDSLLNKPFVKILEADSSIVTGEKKPEKEKKPNDKKWFLDLYASPDYPIISPHENTQSKISYTIGLKLNRSLGRYFSVKTGIQYSEVNFEGNDSIFAWVPLHIRRLDLPVLIGYSLGKGNLKTTINGGVLLNLYSWVRPESVQNFFESNLGLSLYLGINFEKRVKDKMAFFIEPYYRYQLSSMTINSVSNAKFIDIVGVSIGVRYFLK